MVKKSFFALIIFVAISDGLSAVITGTCEIDRQCTGNSCCAVSLWLSNLRTCTPLGNQGDQCHPLSHRVPFSGKRKHNTCPCLSNLVCRRTAERQYKCL